MSICYNPEIHHRRSIRLKGYDYRLNGAYFFTIVVQDRLCLFGDVVENTMRLNAAGDMVIRIWDSLTTRFPGTGLDAFVVMPNHIHGIIVMTNDAAHPNPVGAPLVGAQCANVTHANPVGAPLVGAQCANVTHANPVGAPLVGAQCPSGRSADTVPGKLATRAPTAAHISDESATRAPTTTRISDESATRAPTTTRISDESATRAPTRGAPTRPVLGGVVGAFKSLVTVEYTRGVKASGWPIFNGRLWQRNYYEHIIRNETSLDRIRCYIEENPARWDEDAENPLRMIPNTSEPA